MVDWKKRIEKNSADQLDEGEIVVAGLPLQPAGYLAQQAGMSGVGGLLGFFAGEKAQSNREAETSAKLKGKAAEFPKGGGIVAISSKRLLIFKQNKMSGKPQNLLGHYKLSEVSDVKSEKKKVSNSVLITFDDGSVVDLDAVKGLKVEPFIQAFVGAK